MDARPRLHALSQLARVCDLVRVAPEAFRGLLAGLAPELAAEAEVVLSARFDRLGVATAGTGEPFLDRLAGIMAEHRMPPAEAARLRRTLLRTGALGVFARLEVDRAGAARLHWYLQPRVDLETLTEVARDEGDSAEAAHAVDRLASVVEARAVHLYARVVTPEGGRTRAWFALHARDPRVVRDRVRAAAAAALDDVTALDPAIRLLRLPQGSAAALGLALDAPEPALQLTTPGFPAPGLFPLMELLGRERRRVEWLAACEDALGCTSPRYLGVEASPRGITDVDLYYRVQPSAGPAAAARR